MAHCRYHQLKQQSILPEDAVPTMCRTTENKIFSTGWMEVVPVSFSTPPETLTQLLHQEGSDLTWETSAAKTDDEGS
eukprot:13771212-Ditylum_brightwellii.AAC.1